MKWSRVSETRLKPLLPQIPLPDTPLLLIFNFRDAITALAVFLKL